MYDPALFFQNGGPDSILRPVVYVGAIYGGSIFAILPNTPGIPAPKCTCLDGFEVSQKGKALKMVNGAPGVGDLTSALVGMMICPLLASLALYFSSLEYFALILFSITRGMFRRMR